MKKSPLLTTFAGLTLLLFSVVANAAQFKKLGDWDVHYIVINTSFLTPEVAKQYKLQRSKYQGLVNISVLNSEDQVAQSVAVTGKATNLLGTTKQLSFKQVKEGDAIYYLAVIPFRHQETYRFDIDVQRGNDKEKLEFKHKFYSE